MHEAWCYSKLDSKKVKCNLCIIRCVIADGNRGRCGTRENSGGSLYNTVYGRLSTFSTDFIEKVPLYHFFPNHKFLAVGGVGCNLSCDFCLTWNITQKPLEDIQTEVVFPERLVESALKLGCKGIAYTHSEPTLDIEFYSKVMKIAKDKGLSNVFATNGFISISAFGKIAPLVDAVALTIKGGEDFYQKRCGVKFDKSHFTKLIEMVKEKGIHLEIVYVLIPGENTDEESLILGIELARDSNSPIIFLRFFPSYKMDKIDSPSEDELERALNLAYEHGVEHAYMENIFEHPGKNTYCSNCGCTLIKREGYGIVKWSIKDKRCPSCGENIKIEGEALLLGLSTGE
jgi:pyruvate formate lyase activating enzyme